MVLGGDIIKHNIDKSLAFGFSHAAELDCSTLQFLPEIREMCKADLCHMYDKTWTCPPACGSLDECATNAAKYSKGIIVQSTGNMDDPFDVETMLGTEESHKKLFVEFLKNLKKDYDDILPLGAGACIVCPECSYPDSPCRFPEVAFPSLEGYGIWVSDLCEKNDIPYYYGENTITYTSCYLFK